ncbi:hypothetical protein AB0J72_40335 [Dactylosporangium sp. NPDC049742]|uniref:hypothetical protein n=1 Tax=Dactylosporangium sp. NPDC049742 TaxID=3154737 RepID=UPI00343AA2E7
MAQVLGLTFAGRLPYGAGWASGEMAPPFAVRVHDVAVADSASFVAVGPAGYLERLLAEYGLGAAAVDGLVRTREVPVGSVLLPGRGRVEIEYLVHVSLLRSHGEFPCAGDAEALAFCREVAQEMVRVYGIPETEAVARVNRQWSGIDDGGRTPRVWIVGLDLAYHETPEYWAGFIYYGVQDRWWVPDAAVQPLPPPH